MNTLYFIRTNGYDFVISVSPDGYIRYMTENEEFPYKADKQQAEEFLQNVEDDSSWEDDVQSLDDLIADNEIIAQIEKYL